MSRDADSPEEQPFDLGPFRSGLAAKTDDELRTMYRLVHHNLSVRPDEATAAVEGIPHIDDQGLLWRVLQDLAGRLIATELRRRGTTPDSRLPRRSASACHMGMML
jgi:hypothetical protein